MKNGVYQDHPEKDYHADDAISKTGLWTLYSKTPAHYKYAPPRVDEPILELGKAAHMLTLQPDLAAEKVFRGPPRRGTNEWHDVLTIVKEQGGILLPDGKYDEAIAIRDAAFKQPIVRKLAKLETMYEASAWWTDERTGLQCRLRTDLYVPSLRLMVELKTTADASPWNWSRTVGTLGYHVQEGMYSEGWPLAGGGEVDGFLFIVIEAKPPHCVVVYELDPSASAEGNAIFHEAMDRYKKCLDDNKWPGYPTEIQALDIPHFAYRETDSPHVDK